MSVQNSTSLQFGPSNVLLALDVTIDEKKSGVEILNALTAVQRGIREKFPFVKYIYIQPRRRSEQ